MSVVSRDVPACPLCNSPAVLVDVDDEMTHTKMYTVICTEPQRCGLGSGFFPTPAGALEGWDKRKSYAEIVKCERRDRA